MADEIRESVNEEVEEVNSADLYVDNLNKIKATTVDKNAYDKLAEENKRLANALANGEYAQNKAQEVTEDIPSLEKKIKHCKGMSDLELFTNVLKLRSARLAVDENDDIFVGQNKSASDYANAQAFADQLQEVIEACNGDPMVFASKIRK